MAGAFRSCAQLHRWTLTGLLLAGAFALHGCIWSSSCGEYPPVPVVRLPHGTFGPAVVSSVPDITADPLVYPHGAIGMLPSGAWGWGGADGAGGEGGAGGAPNPPPTFHQAIPSARIQLDREASMVTRSYVDANGNRIEERYRITRVQ